MSVAIFLLWLNHTELIAWIKYRLLKRITCTHITYLLITHPRLHKTIAITLHEWKTNFDSCGSFEICSGRAVTVQTLVLCNNNLVLPTLEEEDDSESVFLPFFNGSSSYGFCKKTPQYHKVLLFFLSFSSIIHVCKTWYS